MTQEAKILLGIGVVTVGLVIGFVFFLSRSDTAQKTPVNASASSQLLIRNDQYRIGSDSAKVTIVEFGDYQCPACGQAHPIVKQILADYQGKISFLFRNFPLSQHKNSQISAEAVEAAGEQGKFWEMHDKLYENQNQWVESNQPLDIFTNYAKELGLDVAKFQNDVTSNKFAGRIKQDQNDGDAMGINATPTFFLNGQKIEGVLPYSGFKAKIDTLLK